jgi:hypothetical protein
LVKEILADAIENVLSGRQVFSKALAVKRFPGSASTKTAWRMSEAVRCCDLHLHPQGLSARAHTTPESTDTSPLNAMSDKRTVGCAPRYGRQFRPV